MCPEDGSRQHDFVFVNDYVPLFYQDQPSDLLKVVGKVLDGRSCMSRPVV